MSARALENILLPFCLQRGVDRGRVRRNKAFSVFMDSIDQVGLLNMTWINERVLSWMALALLFGDKIVNIATR